MGAELRWRTRTGIWSLVFAFAVIWPLALPYSEATRNANEVPRVLQSLAIADHARLDIGPLIVQGMDAGPDVARVQDRVYPNKPPAVSVLGALVLKLGDLLGHTWTMRSFTFALRFATSFLPTLLLLGLCARRYADRYGPSVMVVAGLLYAVATPVLSYARLAYGHTLAGAISMIGVLLILQAREKGGQPLAALGGGCLCALAISADYMAAFWGPALALGLGMDAWKRGDWRCFTRAAAGAVLGLLPLLWYHHAAFDSIWSTGYHHSATQAFAQKHDQGLLGLTGPTFSTLKNLIWSPGGGLLWWMPLSLVGALGVWQEQRGSLKTRLEGRLLLAVFLTGLAVNLGLNFEGGWRVGPRYLIAFMPAIMPGLAFMLAKQRGEIVKVFLLGCVAMYSLWVNLSAASLWPHFDLAHVNSPMAEVIWPLLEQGATPYGVASGLLGGGALLLYLLMPLAVVWYLYGKLQFVGYRMTLAWAGATLVGGLLAMVLARAVHPHPDAQRNLRYIQKVWEPHELESGGFAPTTSRRLPRHS